MLLSTPVSIHYQTFSIIQFDANTFGAAKASLNKHTHASHTTDLPCPTSSVKEIWTVINKSNSFITHSDRSNKYVKEDNGKPTMKFVLSFVEIGRLVCTLQWRETLQREHGKSSKSTLLAFPREKKGVFLPTTS